MDGEISRHTDDETVDERSANDSSEAQSAGSAESEAVRGSAVEASVDGPPVKEKRGVAEAMSAKTDGSRTETTFRGKSGNDGHVVDQALSGASGHTGEASRGATAKGRGSTGRSSSKGGKKEKSSPVREAVSQEASAQGGASFEYQDSYPAAAAGGGGVAAAACVGTGRERPKPSVLVHCPPTHTHTLADMALPALSPIAAAASASNSAPIACAAADNVGSGTAESGAACASTGNDGAHGMLVTGTAVKSENALLVAAGVVSDDETEGLVHFAVPRAAIHQSLSASASLSSHEARRSPVAAGGGGLRQNQQQDAVSASSSVNGNGLAHSSSDMDLAQFDASSPARRRSQKANLSRQQSVASRHSPHCSTYYRRSLSHSEPLLNVYPFVEPRHPSQLLSNMEKLWHDKSLCDIVLCVDGRRIPAHRVVLSSISDYFMAMFAGDMVESRLPEVVIHDIDGAAMNQLVAYAYTCKVDIHSQNVQSLLKASSILQIRAVMTACQHYMAEQLHPSNCLGIRLFSQQFGCTELYESAEKFVEECFLDVIKQEEYLQLGIDDVVELLSRDDVNVENECQVYEAVLRWIQHTGTGEDRRKFIAKLLGCVRLPFLPAEYIADRVEPEEVIKSSPECQPLLLEALKYHLLPERCILSENPRTQPRRSTVGSLFAVGGMDLSRGAMTIEEYNYRINEWQAVGEMHSRRLQCGVAVLGRYIYTVGGRDGLKTLNSVERFDTRHRTWSTVASMCTHRHGVGVAVLSGPMYAVGGHDGWSYLNTVERFDPESNSWSFLAPMNAARSTAGVAVLNGRLYAVGGRDSISCLSSMECYDPHRNRWTACAPMSQRRGGVGVAVCNGKLFAVGGHEQATPFDLVECYDPAVEQWTKVTPMMSCRDAVGVTCFANKLFAVGGYNGYMYLNSVECLNLASMKWENKSVLCTGRAGAGVVAVKDMDPPDEEDLGSAL